MNLMIIKHEARYNRGKDIANKIEEESKELQEALKSGEPQDIVNEALDLITVCLNAINEQADEVCIEDEVIEHQKKLSDRGWKSNKRVSFHIYGNE